MTSESHRLPLCGFTAFNYFLFLCCFKRRFIRRPSFLLREVSRLEQHKSYEKEVSCESEKRHRGGRITGVTVCSRSERLVEYQLLCLLEQTSEPSLGPDLKPSLTKPQSLSALFKGLWAARSVVAAESLRRKSNV